MERLPKIVSERLRIQAVPGNHPDANLLTAYAEMSLDDREREGVAAHLSVCSDCREIVFLATPPAIEETAASAVPRKQSWLSVPMLKWGTAGALAVIVGTAALLLRTNSQPPRPSEAEYAATARSSAPSAASPAQTSREQESVPAPQATFPAMQLSRNVPKSIVPPSKDGVPTNSMQLQLEPRSPSTEAQASDLPLKGRNKAELRRDQPAPAPLVAGALDKKATGAAGAAADGISSNFDAVTTTAESKETVQVSDAESSAFVKAKPAQAKAEAGVAPTAPGVSGGLAVNKMAARANAQYQFASNAASWRVSPAGEVQRSADGGRTWNSVAVGQPSGFRVVTVIGPHVWAGGNSGALYHSSDAGATWSTVTPTAAGAKLTGDVTAIAFSDPQSGKVTTSSGETWTTLDAGETWQKL
jgi:Photosynthesis system II assembly factor YCF48